MTLRKKILIGYGLAFATLSLVLVWAVLKIVSLGDASSAILKDNYKSIVAADAMRRILTEEVVRTIGPGQYSHKQRLLDEGEFNEWLGRARDNITIEAEESAIDSIRREFTRFQLAVAEYLRTGSTVAESGRRSSEVLAAAEALELRLKRLRLLNEEAMYRASANTERVSDGAQFSTIAIGLTSLLLGIVFSFYLSNKLVQPLRVLARGAKALSEGTYDIDIPVTTRDELGILTKEFNAMAGKLAEYHALNVGQLIAAQQQNEAILANIDDGIIVVDTSFKIAGLNARVAELLHLDATQGYKYRLLREILPDETVLSRIGKALTTATPPNRANDNAILTIQRGKDIRQLECIVTPMTVEEHRIIGAVVLLRDVTRYKELDQLKTDFVMAASHELRTPLTGIGMSIDLLQESAWAALEPRERELLTAAHEEVERLKSLVNDLLDLSKIESGRIDLQIGKVPVQLLADRIVGVFAEQMTHNGLNFTCDIPTFLPSVRIDANKIIWVMTNLVSNAMRYVERGGTVAVQARQHGSNIYISVSDTGKGIPQQYQTKIFEKFVQLDGMSNHGSGLGLAICKEMVRAHGGTIWVDSEPGKGSTFTFTIPIA